METTLVFGGCMVGLGLGFWGLALVFGVSWIQRRRDWSFVLFALLSSVIGLYSLSLGAFYCSIASGKVSALTPKALLSATAVAPPGIVMGMHFAVRFTRVRLPAWGLGLLYALGIGSLLVLFGGAWWAAPLGDPVQVSIGRWMLWHVRPSPSFLAVVFYLLGPLSVFAMSGVFWWSFAQGRKESLAAGLGATAVAFCTCNDAWLGLGKGDGVFLSPFGYLVFAFGVSMSLVHRFGAISNALEASSNSLREKSDELQASYRQLKQTQRELVRREQLAVVGELAAVIAHEVRNPLAIIGNAAAGLRKSHTSEEDRATLTEIIDEETTRLNRLVGDLLNYARPVNPQRASLDLKELVQRSLALTENYPHLVVKLDVDEDAPQVWGDRMLLRQVFDNLIGNACQAMSEAGHLQVSIEQEVMRGVRGTLVSIVDTGEGMDSQVRSRARTPFFTTRPSGTGLGLAIVDRIIEAHSGAMALESDPGQGTRVNVFLPTGSDSHPPPRLPMDSDIPELYDVDSLSDSGG